MKDKQKKIIILICGAVVVTFLTLIGTLAFFEADADAFVRNVIVTNVIFVIFNVIWIKLHRGYETMYKSGLEVEAKK